MLGLLVVNVPFQPSLPLRDQRPKGPDHGEPRGTVQRFNRSPRHHLPHPARRKRMGRRRLHDLPGTTTQPPTVYWWRIIWTQEEQRAFPRRTSPTSDPAKGYIGIRECFAVYISLMLLFITAPNHIAGQRIPVWSDNMSTVSAIAKWLSKKDPTINLLLKRLVLRARSLDIELSHLYSQIHPSELFQISNLMQTASASGSTKTVSYSDL